jgi:hypothetical protein
MTSRILAAVSLLILVFSMGCDSVQMLAFPGPGDTDSYVATDSDSDTDTDGDSDTDLDAGEGAIVMDCSGCSAEGPSLDNMACAVDLCDDGVVTQQDYSSPMNLIGCTLEDTYEAVARFGTDENHLAPKLGGSYALMASGLATGTAHSTWCDDMSLPQHDTWSLDGYSTYDVMEWKLTIKAPDDARSFRFKYVFFSTEYDENIGLDFNDKFYVILEAPSTNQGAATVINFTECRDPDLKYDFICGPQHNCCTQGEKYCYIAVNSALSECCWYNGCLDGLAGTDIAGTGYECAASKMDDSSLNGSSTGWLQTAWPIMGGETFTITFHIHDTSNGVLDSEVIIDAFQFLQTTASGTVIIE